MIPIRRVAVIGTGTLGAQIAIHASHHGYQVSASDPDPKALEKTVQLIRLRVANSNRDPVIPLDEIEKHARGIRFSTVLKEAVADADLIIEAVPEDLGLKRKIFAEIDASAPQHAIIGTNSSSIPVSRIESATRRPSRCLNIHFYSLDLGRNMADVMGGSATETDVLEAGNEWVRSLGCVPLAVKKELLGFCFNRVWRAVKRETLHMWAGGYADFRDIDRGWMIWTGMPQGPFGIMDAVGLDVVYGIESVYYSESKDPKDRLPDALREKIGRNELGVKTGKGFYNYPEPEFKDPGFLIPKGGKK
ncbi:MAG TPA: 3-hydroxyacyl-CoA dehydrogenase NAD-binding domain-containing protein [Thermodesulfobacteriota bacterium]|nr:3-hydroxyacyl-CoA dehydrogenase NAD-binding domain-containing protein [Thermodesulfobacteriota bacterium]